LLTSHEKFFIIPLAGNNRMPTTNKTPLYRVDLIAYAMERRGWDIIQTADECGVSRPSVDAALAGKLKTTTKLRQMADGLGVSWKHLFDLELPKSKFHLAVLNGGSAR
jgi:transcriptional regulator with XRE-family HTH domain